MAAGPTTSHRRRPRPRPRPEGRHRPARPGPPAHAPLPAAAQPPALGGVPPDPLQRPAPRRAPGAHPPHAQPQGSHLTIARAYGPVVTSAVSPVAVTWYTVPRQRTRKRSDPHEAGTCG